MSAGPVVCLDLSSEQVTGVQVSRGRIDRWFKRDFLPGTLPGGAPADSERLAAQLAAALEEAGVSARRARMSIPDAALLTRVVALPKVARRDLVPAARYAVERAIPIPPSEAAWEWTLLRLDGGRCALRIVAGWRDVVEKLRDAAANAGLEVEHLEPRSASLASLLPGLPTLVLEQAAGNVRATAVAQGLTPFTAQAPVPSEAAGWAPLLESLTLSARRHLGSAGRELDVLVTADLLQVVPAAVGAHRVNGAIGDSRLEVPARLPAEAYLGALGLAIGSGRSRGRLASKRPLTGPVRAHVQSAGTPWVPALAAISIVSWGAVAAGAALLLGWHPSWPLAP